MHPYWMEKLEEQRKLSVSTFWIVMFFIVILPLLFLVSTNVFIILGILCFAGAGLRLYWQDFGQATGPKLTSEMRDVRIKEAFEKYSSPPLPGVKAAVRSNTIVELKITGPDEKSQVEPDD